MFILLSYLKNYIIYNVFIIFYKIYISYIIVPEYFNHSFNFNITNLTLTSIGYNFIKNMWLVFNCTSYYSYDIQLKVKKEEKSNSLYI